MHAVLLFVALSPALIAGNPKVAQPTNELATEVIITDIPEDMETSIILGDGENEQNQSELAPVLRPHQPQAPQPTPSPVTPARSPQQQGSVIVVCPPTLLGAMAPWIEYRQNQGYRVVQVDGQLTAAEIVGSIRKFARNATSNRNRLKAVVLVGDAEPGLNNNAVLRRRSVPTFVAAAPINEQITGDPKVPTDNPYGDMDGDQIADVAVGRLSVDSPEQLTQLVRRIIDYERLPHAGDWRRTVHLTAGVGDFGPIADTVIETSARKFLTDGLPAAYRTTMTYGNARSPYCPDPRVFRETMLRRVNEGCLFWVYMGHGQPHRLDRFEVAKQIIPILESKDVPRFRSANGMPIAIMLACFAGAYDVKHDCLAERMLRTPNGPIGVLAASRVTLPYSMTLLGTSLMEGLFASNNGNASSGNGTRLGDLFLHAKRGLVSEHAGGKNRKMIEAFARTLSPTKDNLPQERQEHQFLFNLLGDPLLEIRTPAHVPIACEPHVRQGQVLRAEVAFPIGGRCEIELVCRRDRLTFSPPRRKSLDDHPEQITEMNGTYARANDARWFHQTIDVSPGRFNLDVPIPVGARGPSHLRVAVQGPDGMAIGSSDVYIQQLTSSAQKDRRTTTKR